MSIFCSGSGEFYIVCVFVRFCVIFVIDVDFVYFGEFVLNESFQYGVVLFIDIEIYEEIQGSIKEDSYVNNVFDVRV